MLAHCTWSRVLVVAIVMTISSPYMLAQSGGTKLPPRTTEVSRGNTPREEHERAGSPELGVLIIIGVVGFLIFIAWVFSRVGEGGSRHSDGTMN
jgi:hypothetical protein